MSSSFKANNSLHRNPDADASRNSAAYCSRLDLLIPSFLACTAIFFDVCQENDTALRVSIFICNLSRSGIARPIWENGGFLSFENADRTRCIVRRMFLIVTHERPCSRFFQIHSLTESIVMCSTGVSFQSGSRW